MSESGALAARTQRIVAPGDNLSKPALAAVSPASECVRLSIQMSVRRQCPYYPERGRLARIESHGPPLLPCARAPLVLTLTE